MSIRLTFEKMHEQQRAAAEFEIAALRKKLADALQQLVHEQTRAQSAGMLKKMSGCSCENFSHICEMSPFFPQTSPSSPWVSAVGGRKCSTDSAALKRAVTCCNMLQRSATCCNMLHHAASCCNTLQQAATHCNMLRHTARCCN